MSTPTITQHHDSHSISTPESLLSPTVGSLESKLWHPVLYSPDLAPFPWLRTPMLDTVRFHAAFIPEAPVILCYSLAPSSFAYVVRAHGSASQPALQALVLSSFLTSSSVLSRQTSTSDKPYCLHFVPKPTLTNFAFQQSHHSSTSPGSHLPLHPGPSSQVTPHSMSRETD